MKQTFIFLRFQQVDKLHIDVKLHGNNQGNLQQDQLQLLNACKTDSDECLDIDVSLPVFTPSWEETAHCLKIWKLYTKGTLRSWIASFVQMSFIQMIKIKDAPTDWPATTGQSDSRVPFMHAQHTCSGEENTQSKLRGDHRLLQTLESPSPGWTRTF